MRISYQRLTTTDWNLKYDRSYFKIKCEGGFAGERKGEGLSEAQENTMKGDGGGDTQTFPPPRQPKGDVLEKKMMMKRWEMETQFDYYFSSLPSLDQDLNCFW